MTDDPMSVAPDLTTMLLGTGSLDQFLQALIETAMAQSPAAYACGITLEREHRPLTVVSVGDIAAKLDEAQYGQDDGPCLRSLRTGEEIIVRDMLSEERFGPYPAYAAALGTLASASIPIAAHTDTAGALNLYFPRSMDFQDEDLAGPRSIADRATGAIELAKRLSDAQEFTDDLQTALRSRSVIDQAIGVIVGQQRCSAEEAFRILRNASQHRNIKLRDLCAELITNITGHPPTPEEGLRPRP